ncbi:MAG: hypothetical protein D6B25_19460 [Desulfobulbaceae bacterium]|nr:MAG: hypothetical protein D6B25_19460 [Desulfobulbaceae bacterium]
MLHRDKNKPIRVAVIHQDHDYFEKLERELARYHLIAAQQISNQEMVAQQARENKFDIALVAENVGNLTGMEIIKQIVSVNPLVNCALVSPLYPDEFHDATEGFGLFMQIPTDPDHSTTQTIIDKISKITGITITKRES